MFSTRYLITLLVLTFFCHSIIVVGQNQKKIDSLTTTLSKTFDSSARIEIQKQLFELYLTQDLDSAEVYKKQILKVKSSNDKENAENHLLAAKYQFYKYNLDSAMYHTEKANKIAEEIKDNNILADSHFKLGVIHAYLKNPEKEEFHRSEALKIAKTINDWPLIGKALIGLANQYFLRDNLSQATQFYISADSLYDANNYTGEEAVMVYENLSRIYINTGDEKALTYANKVEALYKAQENRMGLARNLSVKGQYYLFIKEDAKSAVPLFEEAYKIFKNYGTLKSFDVGNLENFLLSAYSANKEFKKAVRLLNVIETKIQQEQGSTDVERLFDFYTAGGQLYADLGDYGKSIVYLEEALALDSINPLFQRDENIKEVYQVLGDVYFELRKYRKSSKIRKLSIKLSDSLNTIRNISLAKELEAKYQSEKKEQDILLLQAKNETVEVQKRNQRNMLMGGLGATTLAGVFLFFLFRNRQKTNRKLRELDTAKSNFFANISHELRTPLALIATPIQEKLNQKNLSAKDRKEYELILRNNNRLTNLVNQLLDLSKLESGNLNLKITKTQVRSFLETQVEPYAYLAESNKLTLQNTMDIQKKEVWVDREALQKILSNLLSNAIKYTKSNGSIHSHFTSAQQELKIEIKNTSKPLDKAQKEQIFNRFYQADQLKDGAGIGLALVKELVDLHNGEISVKNEDDGFVVFTVTLPSQKSSFKSEDIFEEGDSLSTVQKPTKLPTDSDIFDDTIIEKDESLPLLLIVEDNTDLRTVLNETFKNTYRITMAKDGEEGMKKAIEQIPDLILSDVMMPKKNGVDLTKVLKNHELTSHIPIILLTAKAGDENELQGIDSGADDYVTKPFNNAILKSKMGNLLSIREKMRARYSQEVILKPRDIAVTPTDEILLERIQSVLDTYLIESSFTTEDFARELGYSRMQLHRKLKALTGLSATEFIRSQRLKLAAQLLKDSDSTISEICYQTGFNNLSYFAKCFKEAYDVSPSEYSKK
ncbi:response regulator [Flagellimonas sp. S174]|uniref:response regulator n=1 Tax=Flagellimonas sp. S174 TaxID=3410790 RepID=UPI003BF5B0EA